MIKIIDDMVIFIGKEQVDDDAKKEYGTSTIDKSEDEIKEFDHAVDVLEEVTKVVKMLKEILDKSRADGVRDGLPYAKLKSRCDQTIQEKEASMKKLAKSILVIETKISKIMAKNGKLSTKFAGIKHMICQLDVAVRLAKELRDNKNSIFIAKVKNYKAAIDQCEEAIKTIAEVGIDQTLGAGQEHKQHLAGMSLAEFKARVRSALLADFAFAPKEYGSNLTSSSKPL